MPERDDFNDAKRAISTAHENASSICAPFLAVAPAAGAAVSILAGLHGQSTVCASDDVAARLDEMQFDLGEGPCWEAMSTRRPVLASHIRAASHPTWPVFAETLRGDRVSASVKSMYAFPLSVGSLDIGAVDLYYSNSEQLTSAQVADVSELAALASWQVLRRILSADSSDLYEDEVSPRSRREVHQAIGMVLAQLGISAADAALLLRAHAFSTGRSVREVASEVVARSLDFGAGWR